MKYFLKCSRRCLLAAPEQWMSVVIVLLKFTFILLSSLPSLKKQKIKIQSKGWIFKNIILKKRKKYKVTKIIYIYI